MSSSDAPPPARYHEIRVTVRYAESDQMGFAHHSTAVVWFEMGRIAWLRELGMPYGELESQGMLMPVVRLQLRYHTPARFEDRLVIQTRLIELGRVRLTFENRILQEAQDGFEAGAGKEAVLVAEGQVELACLSPEGRLMRLPEELFGRLKGHLQSDSSGH